MSRLWRGATEKAARKRALRFLTARALIGQLEGGTVRPEMVRRVTKRVKYLIRLVGGA